MTSSRSPVFALIFFIFFSCSQDKPISLKEKLHESSSLIEVYANYSSITEALFSQLRSKAVISQPDLSDAEIDQKVRDYISQKYTPALIKNYKLIYSAMITMKKDFADCDQPEPIKLNEEIHSSLCLELRDGEAHVHYMTNPYSKGWETASVFIFILEESKYKLSAIDLNLSSSQRAVIQGF